MLRFFSVLILCAVAAHGALAETASKQTPQSREQVMLSFAPVVKSATPAVVNVYAKTLVAQRDSEMMADPFFRRFFGGNGSFDRPRERVQNSLGSGVIVDGKGIIVTNNHVVANATELRVVLSDKREFEAKVLLADERTDLAVLKIDVKGEQLPALPVSNSDEVEVGDLVLAIGNPFGVGQTVTSGIVSALARTRVGVTDYQFFIQTDAAINPGNSGGALVNMRGELVGINTAIYSKSGGSIGIGFSIPSNMVQTVVDSAESGDSKIRRPWLGVQLQDVTSDLADSLGLDRPEGALIAKLHPDSPLTAAGLKRGDVLTGFEGHPIGSAQEFGFRVGTARIGETHAIQYRRGEENFDAELQMVAAPETTPRDEWSIRAKTPFDGMTVANLSPAVAEEVGMQADAMGVVVTNIENGPAQRLFQKGDLLLLVNRREIASVKDLRNAVAEEPSSWSIAIERGGKQIAIRLR